MEKLRQEGKLGPDGRLIEQGNLKPVIQAVNDLLKETVKNRSIPSVTEVHMPKATLLVLAQVLLKVNGLEEQLKGLRELIKEAQPKPEEEMPNEGADS